MPTVNKTVCVIAFVSPGLISGRKGALRSGCRPTRELSWFLQVT